MNNKCLLFILILLSFSIRSVAQVDSLFSQRINELMDLSVVLGTYDSSSVSKKSVTYDSATHLRIDTVHEYAIYAYGMHFKTDVYSIRDKKAVVRDTSIVRDTTIVTDSLLVSDTTIVIDTLIAIDTLLVRDTSMYSYVTLQGAQSRLLLDNMDSSLFISPRDSNVNIIGVPLQQASYNMVYLRDIYATAISPELTRMTILFKPDAAYKRIELFYNPASYELSRMIYYSDDLRTDYDTEDSPEIRYTRVKDVLVTRESQVLVAPDFLSETKYFYLSGGTYYAQPLYSGYSVTTVF